MATPSVHPPRGRRCGFSGIDSAVVAEALGAETEPLLGVLGSEKAVRDGAAGCEYLHLATHGLLDPSSPLDSAVVLAAPEDDAGPENDGFLKARDLMQLDLSACKLVALSACESAKGRVLSGEGVRGLSQAALTAGARSVLCTQWSVYDDSTAALMARFYGHIAAGLARDEALALAMREIRAGVSADGSELQLPDAIGAWQPAWASPVHWAPFALIGEAE